MQTPIEDGNSGTYDFDYTRRSSDDDWQFVSKSDDVERDGDSKSVAAESDDDSIEVILCETSASSTSWTSSSTPSLSDTEFEESENEEHFKDLRFDEVDEIEVINNQVQAVIPLRPCHACSLYPKKENEVDVTNGTTWKVLYSFTLGVVASLIFHHYKDCIPEKFPSLRFGSELSVADIMYSYSFPFVHTNSLDEELNSLKLSNVREDDADLLNRLRSHVEKQRIIADGIFTKQLHLLEHVRQVKSDVYVFNVTKLAQKTTNEDDFISKFRVDKQVLKACDDNITSEQLPLVCEDNHAVLVFVKESRIMTMYDAIRQFSSDSEKKANAFHENLMSSLTAGDGDNVDDDNFVPDCDNFSKRYESNARCARKTERCEDSATTTSNDQDKCSNCKFSDAGNLNEEIRPTDEGGVKDPAVESAPSPVEEGRDESTEARKPISGEWLFHLHEARAKLRSYYDEVVKGDWFVKLGKARAKFRIFENKNRRDTREDSDKQDKDKKDYHYWYKKTSEKLKGRVKTYFAKAKVQMKMVNAAIAEKFKNMRSNLKNKFRQFRERLHDL